MDKRVISQAGFTFIELLVVFGMMTMLSLGGIAAFVSFNNSQTLQSAIGDVKSVLQQAKTQTISQVNTCSGGAQFGGYKVLVCCRVTDSCSSCTAPSYYEIDIVCGSTSTTVTSKNLPNGVSVDGANTTSRSFLFTPLTGTVTGAGQIMLQGFGKKTPVTVNATGVIQ